MAGAATDPRVALGSAVGEGVTMEGSREIRRATVVRVGRVVVEEGWRARESLTSGSAGTGKFVRMDSRKIVVKVWRGEW